MTRDKLIETMKDSVMRSVAWSSFWSDDDARELMRAALTALEAEGVVCVPANEREAWAADVGALLGMIEMMEDGLEPPPDSKLRHLDIASRFGHWAVAKAASPMQRDASSDRQNNGQ